MILQTELNGAICKIADTVIAAKRRSMLHKSEVVIEDIKKNRNWSWYRELRFRNDAHLEKTALFYRGNEIAYGEMFGTMADYAKSLKALNVGYQNEILICMPNIPEFIYTMGAVSMIGAVVNSFAADFAPEQVRQILDGADSGILFLEDNAYETIRDSLQHSSIKTIVMVSLADSFKDGRDFYEELDRSYAGLFVNKVKQYKVEDSRIISIEEFLNMGHSYEGDVEDKTITLDDPFTITYSSGTTSKWSKGLVHAAKSYNIATRFHDPEINHTPSFKLFKMMASLPTYSSTDLISGISDALTQGCCLTLEPIGVKEFAVEMLMINRPSYLDWTRCTWLYFAKQILLNPKYKDVKLPELMIGFSVGEPTELNEEILINKALKKVKAGRAIFPFPFQVMKLSIAGGSTENGGFYMRLFRAYSNMNPIHRKRKEEAGVKTLKNIRIDILDENNRHCLPYQMGTLVAVSDIDMLGYHNMPDLTKDAHIVATDGTVYYNCNVNAYVDIFGGLHLRGRQGGTEPTYKISDTILYDRDRILSCEIENSGKYYIVHIEPQPGIFDIDQLLIDADCRLWKILGKDIRDRVLYRIHSTEESFETAHSGKRYLKLEGITDKCCKPVQINGQYKIKKAIKF